MIFKATIHCLVLATSLGMTVSASDVSGEDFSIESLKKIAGDSIPESDWSRLVQAMESYFIALNQTRDLLDSAEPKSAPNSIHPDSHAPWGDPIDSLPPISIRSIRYWNGNPTNTPVPPEVSAAIPSNYHLAEQLNIGTNAVHLELSYVDGKLFTSASYGFHLSHRIRYDLIGTFHLNESNRFVETFRRSIVSRARSNNRRIYIGADVKPHKVSLAYLGIEHETTKAIKDRPWNEEKLYLRFPHEFNAIRPSPLDQSKEQVARQRIQSLVQLALSKRRQEQVENRKQLFKTLGLASKIHLPLEILQAWEIREGHTPTCQLPVWSSRLLSHPEILDRIDQQYESRILRHLNGSDLVKIKKLAHSSLIHGLFHRVPASRRLDALIHLTRLQGHDQSR